MFSFFIALLSMAKNNVGSREPVNLLFEQNKQQSAPYLLQQDPETKSFEGLSQTTVRMPFGPNPQQRYINDMSLLSSQAYQQDYQRNIGNVTVGTEDWRVDPLFNSNLNNYASFHMPEANIGQIQKFWEKRNQELSN